MTTPAEIAGSTKSTGIPEVDTLPPWTSILAVVAHPDDESFGLGAVLDSFARRGSRVHVLCLTHGEASTLHGVESVESVEGAESAEGVAGDLWDVRESELIAAADILGLSQAWMLGYPDGALAHTGPDVLTKSVLAAANKATPDGFLVFDTTGITGHPDHIEATAAAVRAAEKLRIPVLGWTLPDTVADQLNAELGSSFAGRPAAQVDLQVRVDRTRQRAASRAHASQALPESVLWRRLDLLGDGESLRWLSPTAPPTR